METNLVMREKDSTQKWHGARNERTAIVRLQSEIIPAGVCPLESVVIEIAHRGHFQIQAPSTNPF
jgi:hypothetical protein